MIIEEGQGEKSFGFRILRPEAGGVVHQANGGRWGRGAVVNRVGSAGSLFGVRQASAALDWC